MIILPFLLLSASQILTASATFFSKPGCVNVIYSVIDNHNAQMALSACLELLHVVPTDQLTQVPESLRPALSGNQVLSLVMSLGQPLNWREMVSYHYLYPMDSRLTQVQLNRLQSYEPLTYSEKNAIENLIRRLRSTKYLTVGEKKSRRKLF